MANQAAIVITAVNQTGSVLKKIAVDVNKITKATQVLGSAMNRIKVAAQFYVLFKIFTAIKGAIDLVVGAIPNLIRRGDEWLRVLDNIQDATGMTAEQASKFAYAARVVGVDVENVGRDLSYLARNVIENEQQFTKFGIRVRDANGELKDSYEIFQSTRQALSRYGRQFITAAAAQRIFSEGGRSLIDLLTLTDAQWKRLMTSARQSGAIMSQAAISSAEAWRRSQNMMQQQLDNVGAKILGGVAPVLIALTTGVTKAINANMGSIVDFVQRVIVVIAGFLGGLFGIEFNLKAINKSILNLFASTNQAAGGATNLGTGMDDAASGTQKATGAIDRQVDALDRQLKRLDRIEDRRAARREFQDLQRDIAQARAELSAVRSEVIFASGMSGVEAELQRQAQAADIIAGEKRLAEAKRKLRDFERQQELDAERNRLQKLRDALQDRLSAATAAAAKSAGAIASSFQSMPKSISDGLTKSSMKIKGSLKELLRDSQKTGKDIAEALKRIIPSIQDLLFGEVTGHTWEMPEGKKSGPMKKTGDIRSGGLQKTLQDISKFLAPVGEVLTAIKGFLDDLDMELWAGPLFATMERLATDVLPNLSSAVDRLVKWLQGLDPGKAAADLAQSALDEIADIGKIFGFGQEGATPPPAPRPARPRPQRPTEEDGPQPGPAPDLGVGAGVTARWQPPKEIGFTRADAEDLWGRGSYMGQTAEDQLSSNRWVAENTQPIAEGTMGTTVNDWNAGRLDSNITNPMLPTKIQNNLPIDTKVNNKVDTDVKNKSLGVYHWAFKNTGKVNKWNVRGALPVAISSSSKGLNVLDKGKATVGKQNVQINLLQQISKYLLWASHGGSTWAFDTHPHYGKGYAAGTRYVPETGPALLHQGEAVLTASQVRRGGMGGGNMTIQLDARATRDFLSGRAVNTSLRPQMGT